VTVQTLYRLPVVVTLRSMDSETVYLTGLNYITVHNIPAHVLLLVLLFGTADMSRSVSRWWHISIIGVFLTDS